MNFRDRYDLGSFIVFFFVLSSYLITRILLGAKQKAAGAGTAKSSVALVFLFRRTLRIFPPYYFYLVILMLLPLAGAEARAHAGTYFSYLSNFMLYHLKSWDTYTVHFWTLSVEEQFYITWPWFILFIPDRKLPWFFGALILIAVVFRITMTAMMTDRLLELFPMLVLTPSCVDSFAVGALLAWCHHRGYLNYPLLKRMIVLATPVWLFLVISKWQISFFIGIDRLYISLLAALIIEKANRGYRGLIRLFLENKVTQYLSKISYGIFIYHMLAPLLVTWAIMTLQERFGAIAWLRSPEILHRGAFLFCVLTAVGLATISWYCIEVPINKLRNIYTYFIPKRKKAGQDKSPEATHVDGKPHFIS